MLIIKSEYIRRKLSHIKSIVEDDTKQKLYDINKTAEDIFMHILNNVYGWQLVNANDIKPNFPAIDLIDTTNEIVIQVTSSIDDSKVTSTIEKFEKFADDNYKNGEYKIYSDYQIKMFYIKDKPKKFTKATKTKIANQNMSDNDFLGIEDINKKVSANPIIATKVFKTLCEILHDRVCDSDTPPNLTTKSSTYDSNFIGREDEVKAIDEMLESSNSLLLINGIGGIGKSSLANHYLYTREKKFDYYGFIDGLDSFISEFRNSLDLKAQKEEELYREIIPKLQGLQGKKLLVIDNVEDIESHKNLIEMLLSLHKYDYKVLFTSRRKIKNVKSYPLGTLLLVDAQKLFLNCFKKEERAKLDKSKVNEIIDYLGLHTLFIKLVAETIENEGYSLDYILEKFKNGELSKIVFGDEENDDDITFNKILQDLFSMQTLNDRSKLLLKRLAVLPSIDIEFSFLEEILGKERLKRRLDFLVGRGWLIENKGSYKLHQIIKEFMLLPENAPCFEEIEEVFKFFQKSINKKDFYDIISSTNQRNVPCYESIYNYLIKFQITNKEIADYFSNISHLYNIQEQYEKAEKSLIKAIEIGDKLQCNTSSYYHNLGSAYLKKEEYEKSEFNFKKSIEVEKKFDNEPYDLAMSYNSLGKLYSEFKNYDFELAKKYYFEAFYAFDKYNLSSVSLEIAGVYNSLGTLYLQKPQRNKEDIKKAELCIQKSLKMKEENLDENHPSLFYTYLNLSALYFEIAEIKEAIKYQKKAIAIQEKVLPKNHSDLKKSREELEIMLKEL